MRLRSLQVAILAYCSYAERTHGLFDVELLPTECNGQINLDGRYKTEGVEYEKDCTLHGAPGTEVEVVGEIHFLQNARLKGSLTFRGAKTRGEDHRCVDVEGSLDSDADVEFIDCGGKKTEDGGGFYVEQDVNISGGKFLVQRSTADVGGCAFAGGRFIVDGGTVQFRHCQARDGGGLYLKAGPYIQNAGDVSFVDCTADGFGGGLGVERGSMRQFGGTLAFQNCHAKNLGGAVCIVQDEFVNDKKRSKMSGKFGKFLQAGGSFTALNCTADPENQFSNGGFIAADSIVVKSIMRLDTGLSAASAGCINVRRYMEITGTGALHISNCRTAAWGGAIFTDGYIKVRGRLDIRHSYAGASGGAINCRGKLMFLGGNATFENVSSKSSGGAIWTNYLMQEGGNVDFAHTHASFHGGAVKVRTLVNQSHMGRMSFTSCTAHVGGALHAVGVWQESAAMQFYQCRAKKQGGAIFVVGGVVQLRRNSFMSFEGCKTAKSGGGIHASTLEQRGRMSFKNCSARRSGGGASVTDVIIQEPNRRADEISALSTQASRRMQASGVNAKYLRTLQKLRGKIGIYGSLECRGCVAGAGGALFARDDITLIETGRAFFEDCKADAFGGGLYGRDIRLIGDAVFKNVSALAGGIIQSVGVVEVPGAVMGNTSAPQISALKAIHVSNVSVENSSHVWFVAPEIHLKAVRCDRGLSSFKELHHVGCRTCEENKIQVSGGPVLGDDLPEVACSLAPRGTKEIDHEHLTLKQGYMSEQANLSRSFRCPNRFACVGGTISTTKGWGQMCATGYEGQGCVRCSDGFGPSDSNRFVCVQCATLPLQQYLEIGRFILQDILIFALSASGIASATSDQKDSRILTNHFMSFVAAAGPVLQAVHETPTFKRIMSNVDDYFEGASSAMEAGEGSGGGISASCILGYLGFSRQWWTWWSRALINLFTPFLAVLVLSLWKGWRMAIVVGVNCFLPKACLCFARYLVCYRMEPEADGGELFCSYSKYTGFSVIGLVVVVLAIALSGPALWWMLTSDDANKDAPFYKYLTASYSEDLKSWEVTRLVRKTCLAVVCAALPISLHPAMQIMCISLVLLAAFVLEMHFRPYKEDFWNMEEKLLLTTSLAMVSITSCFLANEYHWSSTYRNQCFLLTIILMLSIIPSNFLIYAILKQLLRESKFLNSSET